MGARDRGAARTLPLLRPRPAGPRRRRGPPAGHVRRRRGLPRRRCTWSASCSAGTRWAAAWRWSSRVRHPERVERADPDRRVAGHRRRRASARSGGPPTSRSPTASRRSGWRRSWTSGARSGCSRPSRAGSPRPPATTGCATPRTGLAAALRGHGDGRDGAALGPAAGADAPVRWSPASTTRSSARSPSRWPARRRLVVVRAVGHAAHLEQPHAVARPSRLIAQWPRQTHAPRDPRRPQARATAASAPARRRSGPSSSRTSPSRRELMGTSHRQKPVKDLVARVQEGLADALLAARRLRGGARQRRDDVLLGRGRVRPRARARAAPRLRRVLRRSSPAVTAGAPFLADPVVTASEPGTAPAIEPADGVDVITWAHNETSTGVMLPVSAAGHRRAGPDRRDLRRGRPARRRGRRRRLLLRAAEVLRLRRRPVAGAAVARPRSSASRSWTPTDRWIPPFLSLHTALDNSRKHQTYNTPALATLLLLADQLDWMNSNGGLDWAVGAHHRVLLALYDWADASDFATPFVADADKPLAGHRHDRLRRLDRRRRRSPRRCAPTASSTPSPTASWAATSCASRCSRPSTRTTSARSRPASTTSSSAPRRPRARARAARSPRPASSQAKASTTRGSNCVPAQRRSSASASAPDRAVR